ncbi:ABC transporter transmembrane domain-containing protein [Fodinicola feengrottensis]|uniref:ABC transporter transmembrane domain-containing protein n=1 Tax=Fodinicola feengrottensis TaxID=435914 RepID=UPI00244345B6|nr:ABC transporter transmembrane domain-containing protein [Fodinicola feengrottensis]
MSKDAVAGRLRGLPSVRRHLVVSTALAVVVAGTVLAQADAFAALLTETMSGRIRLDSASWLLAAVGARAVVGWVRVRLAERSAGAITCELRDAVSESCARRGPTRLTTERSGELVTLLTRGLAGLRPYLSGYLPATVTAAIIPVTVLIRLAVADPTSAVITAVTLPLVPIFGILVGWHTQTKTDLQWRRLSTVGGHFLDVVRGLPTLRMYGRARAQVEVIRQLADRCRVATMATLRIAFLSALVLEILASLAVALVAVPLGFPPTGRASGSADGIIGAVARTGGVSRATGRRWPVPRQRGRLGRRQRRLRCPGSSGGGTKTDIERTVGRGTDRVRERQRAL